MQLLQADYTTLVIEAYNRKQKGNDRSLLLSNLTRANIRQECINIYNERMKNGEKEEAKTLQAFFGVPPAGRNFGYLIERFELDNFRPLENMIKGGVKNPAMVNVELLAWLVDFRLRPFIPDKQVILNSDELAVLGKRNDPYGTQAPKTGQTKTSSKGETGDEPSNTGNSESPSQMGTIMSRLKKAVPVFLIVAALIGAIFFIQQWESSKRTVFGNTNTGCMYWAGDHYEKMLCNEKEKGRFKLPMDEEKMKNFRKILEEDTITEKSIGKVYYIRIGGKIEYYTAGGNHPVDVTKSLRPLSEYMFNKHLNKQEIAKKDQ